MYKTKMASKRDREYLKAHGIPEPAPEPPSSGLTAPVYGSDTSTEASLFKDPLKCTPFRFVLVNFCHYRRTNVAPPSTGPWIRVVSFGQTKEELADITKELTAFDPQELLCLPVAFPFPVGVFTARTAKDTLDQQTKGQRLVEIHHKRCEDARAEVAENVKYRRMGRNELSVEQMMNTDVDEIAARKASEETRRREDENDLVRSIQGDVGSVLGKVADAEAKIDYSKCAPKLKPLRQAHMAPFQNFAIISVIDDYEAQDANKAVVRAWFDNREAFYDQALVEALYNARESNGFPIPSGERTLRGYVIEVAKSKDLSADVLRQAFAKYSPERHAHFQTKFWAAPGAFDYARSVVLAEWLAAHPRPEVTEAELTRYIELVKFEGTREQALKALFEDDRKSHRISTDIALWIDERNYRLEEVLWEGQTKPTRSEILGKYDERVPRPTPMTITPEEPAIILWHAVETEDKAREWITAQRKNRAFDDFDLVCVQSCSLLKLADRKHASIPTRWRKKELDDLMQKRIHDPTGDVLAMFEQVTGKKAKVTEVSEGTVRQTQVHRSAPRAAPAVGLGTLVRKKILDEMGFVDLGHIPKVV